MVKRLPRISPEKLDDAICNIIDLRGFSLAVLLDRLASLPPAVQKRVVAKIEDLLFFHPGRGRRLLDRIEKALGKVHPDCIPNLIAAAADILARRRKGNFAPGKNLQKKALQVLSAEGDFVRKGKAVEILSAADDVAFIPAILKGVVNALGIIDQYGGFIFTETALFALKRMGGDCLLRLMVNPSSVQASQQLRLAWKAGREEELKQVTTFLQGLKDDFAQTMLKVVDLSEFGLPFMAMIGEGLQHQDKWVRQMATSALTKVQSEESSERLERMLTDPAPEVRLMAVSSMGNFPSSVTGEKLVRFAGNESEAMDIRMNALYALFSQKNGPALEALSTSPTPSVAINAQGLRALLMSHEKGLKALADILPGLPAPRMPELLHFLMELARPEDLPRLLEIGNGLSKGGRADTFLEFLVAFLRNRAGPTLEKTIEALPTPQRTAVKALQSGIPEK